MQMLKLMLLVAFLTQNAQPSRSTATVEGRVVVRIAGSSPAPLSGAAVELRGVDNNPSKSYFAESTEEGRFRFMSVPSGRYRLFAAREGYVTAEYGQKLLNGPGIPLDVASDAHLTQMDLTLSGTGAISGRISWPTGQPVGIALVQALRVSYEDGQRSFTVVQSTRTDDLGNFRLFWLAPGQYFLSATVPNGPIDPTIRLTSDATDASLSATREIRRTVLTRPVSAMKDDEIFAPIFYPGTTEERNASSIDVVAGGENRGMDFTAGYIRSFRVRGVIVDSETGEVVKNAQVRATTGNSSGLVALDSNTGAFSLGHLPSGAEYVLTAVAGAKSGRFVISVRDHDFEIRVPIYPSFSVSGRLLVDGRAPQATDLAGLRFMVQGNPTGIGGLQPTGSFGADGTFSFAVAPGDYFINVAPVLNRTGTLVSTIPVGNIPGRPQPVNTAFNVPAALKNVYVKSIRFGEKDVLNDGLHLDGPGTETLEIQLSTHAATLQGTVDDGKGTSVANVVTVLVPDAPLRQRPDLYKVTRADAGGRFLFERIPAGSYRLFAWENILDGAWRDPDVMREMESRGTAITIDDDGKLDAKVVVIPSDAQ